MNNSQRILGISPMALNCETNQSDDTVYPKFIEMKMDLIHRKASKSQVVKEGRAETTQRKLGLGF